MRTKLPQSSAAGFTLIEMIVVMVMIGVLFSIAAPGWLAFSNRQRVNNVRDQLLQEIRRTQALAAQTRRAQTFTINTTNVDPPTIAITPGDPQVRTVGNGQVQAGMIQIAATGGTTLTFDPTGSLVDAQGNPLSDQSVPVKFTVSSQTTPSIRSCAIVQTLLGATRTASGDECN